MQEILEKLERKPKLEVIWSFRKSERKLMFNLKIAKRLTIAISVFTACLPAHAQFGDLLNQLQKIQVPTKPGIAPAVPLGGATQGQGASKGGGLMPSDQWCAQASGALSGMKVDTALIASEFKVADLRSLQDQFFDAFNRKNVSKTFPDAEFFKGSFETKKVRAIYDAFLAFPEPDTLAALIQISRGTDEQERIDAQMALVYLHLQDSEKLSIAPNRWRDLYAQATRSKHYTSMVFKARIAAYGEYGPKNIAVAMGELRSADDLKSTYSEGRPKREFDYQNYGVAGTFAMLDIQKDPALPANLRLADYQKSSEQIAQVQANYINNLPKTRVGKLTLAAAKHNDESLKIGDNIIGTSKNENQFVGQKESYVKLTANDKSTVVSVDPQHNARLLKAFSEQETFSDEQKKMLVQAQERRLAAQGLLSQAQVEMSQDLMNAMQSGQGGFMQMIAMVPIMTQVSNGVISSCLISAKWEQAMRVKNMPKANVKAVEGAVSTDANSAY